MSLLTIEPLSTAQARADSIGYLAFTYTGKRLSLKVCHSAAGHYIGTTDAEGPVSRESAEYFRSLQAAEHALATGRWQQRVHP
ncbi:hypothetical protein [Ralstonia pseudosolanacearum]|uniref:hypothetical protein n=1 Tax=Ralstonia pseudosolanacearum TaxID=1310165 RepID=UPI0040547A66